jgi:hypothetical protein
MTHHARAVADQPRIADDVAYNIMMDLIRIDTLIKEAKDINDVRDDARRVLNRTALRLTDTWYPSSRPSQTPLMPANDQA